MGQSNQRFIVIGLVTFVVVISSLDKTIFAFAGSQLMQDLALTPEQFGLAGSAFFFLYAVSGMAVGFVANSVATRWILVGMALVWAISQFMVAAASTFAMLLASRLLLGVGVGPGTPVVLHACFKWYKPDERVFPAALVQSALMFGALISGLSFPFLLGHFGWRAVYFGLGALSIVWMALWLVFGREGREDHHSEPADGGRYRALLCNTTYVCVTCAGFMAFVPSALALSWTPLYLQKGLGLTPGMVGLFIAVATACQIAVNLFVAPLPKRFFDRGKSFRQSMVAPPMLALALAGLTYLLVGLLPRDVALTAGLLLVGGVLAGLVPMFGNTIIAHITPPEMRGASLAIYNSVVTGAGILVPYFMGWLITRLQGDIAGGFHTFLGAFGLAAMMAALAGFLLIAPQSNREAVGAHGATVA